MVHKPNLTDFLDLFGCLWYIISDTGTIVRSIYYVHSGHSDANVSSFHCWWTIRERFSFCSSRETDWPRFGLWCYFLFIERPCFQNDE